MSILKKIVNTNLVRFTSPLIQDNSKLQYQSLGQRFSNIRECSIESYDYFDKMALMHLYGTLRNEEELHFESLTEQTKSTKEVKKEKKKTRDLDIWTKTEIDYFNEMAIKHALKS